MSVLRILAKEMALTHSLDFPMMIREVIPDTDAEARIEAFRESLEDDTSALLNHWHGSGHWCISMDFLRITYERCRVTGS